MTNINTSLAYSLIVEAFGNLQGIFAAIYLMYVACTMNSCCCQQCNILKGSSGRWILFCFRCVLRRGQSVLSSKLLVLSFINCGYYIHVPLLCWYFVNIYLIFSIQLLLQILLNYSNQHDAYERLSLACSGCKNEQVYSIAEWPAKSSDARKNVYSVRGQTIHILGWIIYQLAASFIYVIYQEVYI